MVVKTKKFSTLYPPDSDIFSTATESYKSSNDTRDQWRSQLDIWSCKCKFFCVYRPYKESITKEMNNDNDLNLHSMTKLSGWLLYWQGY